jgi:hypothetical protein
VNSITRLAICASVSMSALSGTAALAAPKPAVIVACYNKLTGRARIVNAAFECLRDENVLTWNVEGPAGPPGPAGPIGLTGATGPAGPAGVAGKTGSAGPQGATGANGPAGPAGVAGPIGATGPAGAAGPIGSTGPAGPAGVAGPIGSTGPAGPAGVAGPIGPTGPAGVAGPIGPAGPSGPTGPAGPSGTSGIFGSNELGFFAGSGGGAQCTLGSIILNASIAYPTNYLPADGRLIAIQTNTALFTLLGTDFGGNGQTDFALPDLRSAAPNNTQYLICAQGIFP